MLKLTRQALQLITIDPENAGQRIDNYLHCRLKGLPKSRLYRIIRKGEVRVNKGRIKPEYRLQEGDIVRIPPINLQEGETRSPPQQLITKLDDRIIYEDQLLLVIDKPSGVAVHGGSGVSFGVIELLRASRPPNRFLELVHRLDRETSGCLLLAKKPSVLRQLHALLRAGEVEKRYLALVCGHWPASVREVNVPLVKNQLRSGERMVNVDAINGKLAQTLFSPIQHFSHATLVEASPQTGRTHQIRVHAAHQGHSIIGDEKYGDKAMNKMMHQQGCKRLFLHAASLAFTLPDTQQRVEVQAPLSPDLEKFLKTLTP